MATAALYTPQVLELAVSLADYGWDESIPLHGSARSRSCGSTIALGLSIDDDTRIDKVAVKSQACAIGQAAAAIFARHAKGQTAADIRAACAQMKDWLEGSGEMPDWPELDAIRAARDYPARHGAILLAWQAASEMLPTG